ncbi:MAG: hypothetical protein ABF649_13700 [Bacillus sp. (in: firmicutes)]
MPYCGLLEMAKSGHLFSGQNQDISNIVNWYQLNTSAIEKYKGTILGSLRSEDYVPEQFIGMTAVGVIEYFDTLTKEVETSFSLSAIAAIEAKFRMDYIIRATNRLKDTLSRDFRDIYREKGRRASLEEDILNGWKTHHPEHKNLISNYIQSLNYRHWLAHGRYWIPKFGRKYDFAITYVICEEIENSIPFNY